MMDWQKVILPVLCIAVAKLLKRRIWKEEWRGARILENGLEIPVPTIQTGAKFAKMVAFANVNDLHHRNCGFLSVILENNLMSFTALVRAQIKKLVAKENVGAILKLLWFTP